MADAKQQHERLPPVLTGKKALIVGVANEHSIAWGCAQAMRRAGAEIAMTYLNDRAKPHVEPLAKALDAEIFLPLEVRDPAQVDGLFAAIAERWGRLDILVHSVAFAPRDALQGRVVDCPRDGFLAAMDVSCWSFPRPGAPGGTPDAAGRDDDDDVLSGRQRGGRQLRHHGTGQGRAGIRPCATSRRSWARRVSGSMPSAPGRWPPAPPPASRTSTT